MNSRPASALALCLIAATSCRTGSSTLPEESTPATSESNTADAVYEQIVQVATGAESTCVRTERGRVACIGQGMAYTEDEPNLDTHEPQVIDIPPSRHISAGVGFACSVDRDGGQVRCWGFGEYGQLGRKIPRRYDHWPLPVPDLDGVEAIDSLGNTTCARRSRQVTCWPGPDDSPHMTFELGDAEVASRLEAGPPPAGARDDDDSDDDLFDDEDFIESDTGLHYGSQGLPKGYIDVSFETAETRTHRPWAEWGSEYDASWCRVVQDQVSCGGARFDAVPELELGLAHGCASTDAQVSCWGRNDAGQAPPDGVALGSRPKDLDVGAEHSCMVSGTGRLLCWGASGRGQIGLPPGNKREPQVVAKDVANVWTLPEVTCLETTSGEIECAGLRPDFCTPAQFSPLAGPKGIAGTLDADGAMACIVDRDGTVWCHGRDAWTRMFQPSALGRGSSRRSGFTTITIGSNAFYRERTLCWLDDGRARCTEWPNEERDAYGRPPTSSRAGGIEFPFGQRAEFVDLQGFEGILCGLTRDGQLACTHLEPRPNERDVRGSDTTRRWVAVRHELPEIPVAHLTKDTAVLTNGDAYKLYAHAFRKPEGGEDPVVIEQQIDPEQIGAPVAAASGDCVLRRDGQLRCEYGKTVVQPGTTFTAVTTARHIFGHHEHGCATDDAHRLWCWGDGGSGQLGDGRSICSRSPRDLSSAFYEAFGATP